MRGQRSSARRDVRPCRFCGQSFVPWRNSPGRYCSRRCAAHYPRPLTIETRFWAKVERAADCWLWTGATHDNGYGRILVDGKVRKAHRVAWFLAAGAWPPTDRDVGHSCDNPGCVRNDGAGAYRVDGVDYPRFGHLWLAPTAANVQDMYTKDRGPTGERHPRARLTAQDAAAIRQRYAAGERIADLARAYGLTKQGMAAVVYRRTWRRADE